MISDTDHLSSFGGVNITQKIISISFIELITSSAGKKNEEKIFKFIPLADS